MGNGTTATYGYDDANRLLSLAHKKGQNSLDSLGYGYNVLNDRTNRSETVNSVTTNDTYGYDPIDQVTQVKYNYNATTNTQDRLVNYSYDPAGNRSSVTDNGAPTTYTPNVLNQYTAVGSLHPTYDNNGNLTGQGQWTYTYDALNRMTSAFKNGTTVNFAYDARNRCVSRTINGTITFFYYDGWSLIEEQNASSALLARYVNGAAIDEMIAAVSSGVTTYYHQDALGSTVALSTTTGAVGERYSYDIYGAPTIKAPNGTTRSTSSYGNRFLFTGREYIQQALLYDYRNRMYSPTFGRFLQTDPLEFEAKDGNLVRYVRNQPTGLSDPFGLDYLCTVVAAVNKDPNCKDCPKCPKNNRGSRLSQRKRHRAPSCS